MALYHRLAMDMGILDSILLMVYCHTLDKKYPSMMIILVIAVFVAKKVIPLFEQMQTSLDGINRTVREGITGVRVIRAFNREKDSKRRMDRSFEDYAATAIKANKIFAGLMPVIMLIMNILTILFVWFGGKQVAAGRMEIGDIMAVIEYSTTC